MGTSRGFAASASWHKSGGPRIQFPNTALIPAQFCFYPPRFIQVLPGGSRSEGGVFCGCDSGFRT